MNPTELSSEAGDETSERRRSVWIWVILGWAVWGVLSTFALWWSVFRTVSDAEIQAATALMGAGFEPMRLSVPVAAIGTVNAVVLLAGAWKLFMLRAIAVRIFWITAAIGVLGVLVSLATIEGYAAFMKTPPGLFSLILSVALYALVLWYSTRLLRRGVLQ